MPTEAWKTWSEHGPELGYTAEVEYFAGQVGIQIKGSHVQACSGFYPLWELTRHGFDPEHIASVPDLIRIKDARQDVDSMRA
jgi:hypothetical protein